MLDKIIWTDPAVQAAAISAIGSVLAAAIAALCAALVGAQISGRKRLKEKLETACMDLQFRACEVDVLTGELSVLSNKTENSIKLRVRGIVRDENPGLDWSGKFVASKLKHYLPAKTPQ